MYAGEKLNCANGKASFRSKRAVINGKPRRAGEITSSSDGFALHNI
jgi:hypothetical protein